MKSFGHNLWLLAALTALAVTACGTRAGVGPEAAQDGRDAAGATAGQGKRMALDNIPDATSAQVTHVEPPSWWVGMETPLQLMIHGDNAGSCDVSIVGGRGVKVTGVHRAESPNYIFVDISISRRAKSGTYYIVLSRGSERCKLEYCIDSRRAESAQRESFTTADLVYLLMPDRFVNGNPDNDNVPGLADKARPETLWGRHGGDLEGIISQLDYLEDLGVTAVWCTPLLEDNEPRGSYHGYACSDYYKVDARFGGNALYKEFVEEAHRHGIKVIMDVVTNHCGIRHWWYKDLPFHDWVHQWPQYTHSNCVFSMQNDPYAAEADKANMVGGWFAPSMVDMDLDNPFLLQYFKQWAMWWIEWADLDGLRVDTYPYNEKQPMSQWCKAVRAEYPKINIVGEVWSYNVPQVAYWQADNPNKDGFNSNLPSVMNFPLYSALCKGLPADEPGWDGGMTQIYDAVADDFYYHDADKLLIFPGNHDTDRIADILGRDPGRQKIAMALMATLRGIPQIFSADELMAVSADRSQGHGGLRIDFPLGWENDPEAREMHDYCRRLFRWRKSATAVHGGTMKHYFRRDNTYAFFRSNGEQTVMVYINNSPEERRVPQEDYAEMRGAAAAWVNVITGEEVDFSRGVTVGPHQPLIVEKRI